MKKTVNLIYSIDVEYDEDSPEFNAAYEAYIHLIAPHASKEDFLENVVYQAHRGGFRRMIEGAGYVKCKGMIQDETLYCGINIDDDDPCPVIEIEDNYLMDFFS